MAALNAQLASAVDRLRDSPNVDPAQVDELTRAIRTDRKLLRNLNEAAEQGRLAAFAVLPNVPDHSIGKYGIETGVVGIPASLLTEVGRRDDLVANLKLQDMSIRFAQTPYRDGAGSQKAVSQEMIDNLQRTINDSPKLAEQLRSAVSVEPRAHLENFAILDPAFGAGGTYDGHTKTMNLPAGRLQAKGPGNLAGFNPEGLTFTLAHETQHGFNHQDKLDAYTSFDRAVRQIARDKNPVNDYTAPIASIMQAGRKDEALAEIAGWNAVHSRVQHLDGNVTIEDMASLKTWQMEDFLERVTGPDERVVPRAGIQFNEDLSLAPTPANIEAMGRHYVDKPPLGSPGLPEGRTASLGTHKEADYANYYGRNAIERVITIDRKHAQEMGGVEPEMHINMAQLRLDERLIERLGLEIDPRPQERQPYHDTSQSPPLLRHFDHTRTGPSLSEHVPIDPAILADEPLARTEVRPTPAQPGHPDHTLYSQIAAQVKEQDRVNGRSWDQVSERLSASLLSLTKDSGLTRVDHVVFSQKTDRIAAGENVFVVQGRLDDPAHVRAHMKTEAAVQTPEAVSFQKIEAINERATQQAPALQTQQMQEEPSRGFGR